jgi:hypothetical protein
MMVCRWLCHAAMSLGAENFNPALAFNRGSLQHTVLIKVKPRTIDFLLICSALPLGRAYHSHAQFALKPIEEILIEGLQQ